MTTPSNEILHIDQLPDLANTKEVSQFFRTTELTVRKWIKANAFPNAYQEGRAYLIPKPDVIAYMQSKYGQR